MTIRKVAILGGGAAGLTAAHALLEAGLEPTIFEQRGELGGLWTFSESLPDGGGPAYRSLACNSSRRVMAFSDHPFASGIADFPARADVLAYLQAYASRFAVSGRARLATAVELASHAATNGGATWTITSTAHGERRTERFDALLVCTGRYREPALPTYEGQASFTGRILHSRDYRDAAPFLGKRVVVVGTGSSAADLAADLGAAGVEVTLSARSDVWFIPHRIDGQPYDHKLSRFSDRVPAAIRFAYFRRLLRREYRRLGLLEHAGLRSLWESVRSLRSLSIIPASRLLEQLAAGRVAVRRGIRRLDGSRVVFTDGAAVEADVILSCTGYRLDFPFLSGMPLAGDDACIDLYKHVFHPAVPSLAFIGFTRVTGPQFPVLELQGRWVAQVLSGRQSLPPLRTMEKEIDERRPQRMEVQLLPYLDELARLIGARPDPRRGLAAAHRYWFAPFSAAQYRSA